MKNISRNNFSAFVADTLLAYAVYAVCRIAHLLENWKVLGPEMNNLDIMGAIKGSLVFDTAAISYALMAWWVLFLLPFSFRQKNWYQLALKIYFVVINSLAVVVNLCDSVYFQYSGRRTTMAVFDEFENDTNIASIIATEFGRHWYFVILGAALMAALWMLYRRGAAPSPKPARRIGGILLWIVVPVLGIIGIRGGVAKGNKTMTINQAMHYVDTPAQAALILNTPFTLIRNASKQALMVPSYMSGDEAQAIFNPVHAAGPGRLDSPTPPNIFIIIVESLAQEYVGAFNDYECRTPFLDSLTSVSLSFREGFSCGIVSIDALPSILSGIPMAEEHFFLTPYVFNNITSVVRENESKGYSSAFFHGGSDGTMGFDAFARSVGVKKVFEKGEYEKDRRFGGNSDFDGKWAIWDEPFLQFSALKTTEETREPFINTIFTASSHHPYKLPEQYKDRFKGESHPMYDCIEYVDWSLRRFFETARLQPWYDNTIFVITGDHTNYRDHEEYLNTTGKFRVPILFFDPSGRLPRTRMDKIAQHTDIYPTLMGILGAERDYVAFGKDLLDSDSGSWAIHWAGTWDLVTDDGELRLDEETGEEKGESGLGSRTLDFARAFVQEYKNRLSEDRLIAK